MTAPLSGVQFALAGIPPGTDPAIAVAVQPLWTAIYNLYQQYGGTIAGLGTMSVQNANNVAITGGTISGCTIDGLTMARYRAQMKAFSAAQG